MRPEVSAFRELDTLVRKLTDQLAGYRRRALSAEARTREFEVEITALVASLAEAQRETAAATESREHALAAAREATTTARLAREALASMEKSVSSNAPASTDVFPTPTSAAVVASGDADVAAENEQLKARLTEARERTKALAERVRFVRQQLMTGAER